MLLMLKDRPVLKISETGSCQILDLDRKAYLQMQVADYVLKIQMGTGAWPLPGIGRRRPGVIF